MYFISTRIITKELHESELFQDCSNTADQIVAMLEFMLFQVVMRRTHQVALACRSQHRDIVLIVAEGVCVLSRNPKMRTDGDQ